ncbi:MAG: hypothetical protein Q9181_007938 [Wetmoreana brouardii]
MAQKLLLFWRKPARRCWWEGVELDNVEGIEGKLKVWIRRVWTLEMRKSVILLLLTIAAILFYSSHPGRSTFPAKDTNMASDTEGDISPIPSPNLRTQFGGRATLVRGFPSKGGIYLLSIVGLVELDFLALDRFHETLPSTNPSEEDAFCNRMRAMGARWFEDETEADKQPPPRIKDGKLVGSMELWLGWPESGGVWVLEIEEFEGARRGVGGRIRNAKDMEERCKVIEMMGGAFFRG